MYARLHPKNQGNRYFGGTLFLMSAFEIMKLEPSLFSWSSLVGLVLIGVSHSFFTNKPSPNSPA
jgi:hypothetical protein